MTDRIILVGFMCAGKTTVGRALARELGWEFIDFDETIERAEGATIAEIFRDRGEARFRELEADLTRRLAARRDAVLAPGGGWITRPNLVELVRDDSLIVWLRVSPQTVYDRYRSQPEVVRPLLDTADPLDTIRSMLAERAPLYATADSVVDTDDRKPTIVAEEIVRLLKAGAGGARERPAPG